MFRHKYYKRNQVIEISKNKSIWIESVMTYRVSMNNFKELM